MQPLRWGIVGMGRFGAVHANVLSSLKGIKLHALCSRNAERLATAGAQFGVNRLHTDYRQMLDDPEIDIVGVTTHWQEHHDIAKAVLESGKHLLLEKPMAANSDQCRSLLTAAEAAAGLFMIAHVCRFDPRVTLAKQAIEQGRLGKIISMHARRNLPKAPGPLRLDKISPLMGDGIHDADMMLWFMGRTPTQVYGRNIRVDDFTYPDLGWAMLHFGDEAIGVVETVWRLPENTPTTIDAKMRVIGTEGMLTIDCAHTGLTILDPQGTKMPDTVYWPQQHGRQIGALSLELEYFADCVRTGQKPTVITPPEAAQAVAAMEAAELSAAEGRVVDYIDPA